MYWFCKNLSCQPKISLVFFYSQKPICGALCSLESWKHPHSSGLKAVHTPFLFRSMYRQMFIVAPRQRARVSVKGLALQQEGERHVNSPSSCIVMIADLECTTREKCGTRNCLLSLEGESEKRAESKDLSTPSEIPIILHGKPDNSYCCSSKQLRLDTYSVLGQICYMHYLIQSLHQPNENRYCHPHFIDGEIKAQKPAWGFFY